MNEKLDEAIRLRDHGEKEASRRLLLELVAENPEDPTVLFQCAWTHDGLGLEQDAVIFYESAIKNGLSGAALAGARLGLGSTLRGLGEYERALEILRIGAMEFPENKSIQVFLAMALYNRGHSKEAVSSLLRLLAETSSDKEISEYKRAILLYAQDLDRIWDN